MLLRKKYLFQIVKKIAPFKDKLSIAEVLYLKNNIYGQKFINDTERIRLILKIHEEWLKKEYIFWKWMVTNFRFCNSIKFHFYFRKVSWIK